MKKFDNRNLRINVLLTLLIASILLIGCTQAKAEAPSVADVPEVIEVESEHEIVPEVTNESEFPNTIQEYSVNGKYFCFGDYYNVEFFTELHPELIPYIIFNEDGTCIFGMNFAEGFWNVYGVYSIEDRDIYVELDHTGTIFEDADFGESIDASDIWRPSQFVFFIDNEYKLIIDRLRGGISAGDPFYNRFGLELEHGIVFGEELDSITPNDDSGGPRPGP